MIESRVHNGSAAPVFLWVQRWTPDDEIVVEAAPLYVIVPPGAQVRLPLVAEEDAENLVAFNWSASAPVDPYQVGDASMTFQASAWPLSIVLGTEAGGTTPAGVATHLTEVDLSGLYLTARFSLVVLALLLGVTFTRVFQEGRKGGK